MLTSTDATPAAAPIARSQTCEGSRCCQSKKAETLHCPCHGLCQPTAGGALAQIVAGRCCMSLAVTSACLLKIALLGCCQKQPAAYLQSCQLVVVLHAGVFQPGLICLQDSPVPEPVTATSLRLSSPLLLACHAAGCRCSALLCHLQGEMAAVHNMRPAGAYL